MKKSRKSKRQCVYCKKIYWYESSLQRHNRLAHEMENIPYSVDFCRSCGANVFSDTKRKHQCDPLTLYQDRTNEMIKEMEARKHRPIREYRLWLALAVVLDVVILAGIITLLV